MRRIISLLAVSVLLVMALSVPAFADVGNRQATCGMFGQAGIATTAEPGSVGTGTKETVDVARLLDTNLGQLVSPTAAACNQSG